MRRTLLLMIMTLLALGLLAGPAFALHCYVEDKPNGAGAVTEDDLFVNPAGKLIAPGAFIDTEVTGLDNDLFIRGREPFPPFLPPIQGGGSLPPEPHDNGSEDHGVQSSL